MKIQSPTTMYQLFSIIMP